MKISSILKHNFIKRVLKIIGKIAGIVLLLFLIVFLIMGIPAVQTKLGKYATDRLNQDFKTDINIGKVGLQLNGDIELKEILIRDYKKDTLIAIGELNSSIVSFKNLYNSKLNFGDIDIQDLVFNLKTYKGEEDTNLDVFVEKFEDDNPRQGPSSFLLSSSDLSIEDGMFRLIDENLETPEIFEFSQLNANATNFLINGPDVSTRINKFGFIDSRGLTVDNLMANFEYTLDHMIFDKLNIKTQQSELKGDLRFNYKREDLKYFTDKVNLTASFRDSNVSLTELNVFFDEFGINQNARLNADLSGTLNHLIAKNLNVSTTRNTKIIGDITFKNLFNRADDTFELNGQFKNLASNYNDLTALLPRILGNALPTVFSKVGNFRINGTSHITSKRIDADIQINTDLGFVESDLELTQIDDIDAANYIGNIVFNEFNIGQLINDPKAKNLSANLDVDGKGFTLDKLRTDITGNVFSLEYNNYTYQDISLSGDLGNKVFNGKLKTDDPNLQLDFNGLVDFSEVKKKFDFKANVGYANLGVLNFVTRDSISEFKGLVSITATGSTYDNASGSVNIKNTTYKNQDSKYKFQDFAIVSSFEGEERTLSINSPDIISGNVKGKFKLKEVLKLVENSLGSIYANYQPFKVEEDQYMDFRFNVYSKIAAVFFKDLYIGKNTFVEGRVETDEKGFELTFNSPEIKFNQYYANNININVDNGNRLYNTFIEIDKLSAGVYEASDFTLINVTKRDTLLIKTEFKGGKDDTDAFNINLYYTIDEANKSIVGFKKSDILFKGYEWYVNSEKNNFNKIRFDRTFSAFDIFPITINQGDEIIEVSGSINDSINKNINVDFRDVELVKITPRIDSLALAGVVNGKFNLNQTNGTYLPKSNITVSNLFVNNYDLGDLSAKIEGNNSLTAYNVDVSLVNDNLTAFSAKGALDVKQSKPTINVDVAFNEFLLDPLNPLGEGVISNIRGLVSGNAKVTGSLKKPSIDGELLLDRAGLSIPYLNVDYGFDFDSKVSLRKQQFIFNNVAMTDSKYFSQGYLNGYIEHNNFSDWKLGLDLSTDRLLVLNTEESEDELYYGTAFMSGKADIYGPTDQLIVEVDASTATGTVFNIPLNDSESFGDNSFIHFLSPEEKLARINGEVSNEIEVKGLELKFDLNVNQNASIEIVIDKEAGSTIKGKGEGNLGFFINTNGTFDMWGDFTVYEGTYNFKYGGLVEKRFDVEQGGKIEWEGDPLKAQIDIKALYQGTANPSVLLDNPINQSIPVEVIIHLTGQLEQPDPQFDFRFPTVNSTVKSELDYRLSSKDERDNQALFFLATGGFASGLNSFSVINGTIAERLSGIVNNLIGGNNGDLQVGLDFELGQDTPELQTNSRVGLTLQTKISDKIIVNGKVGVPFGSAQQTTITGDVQIDWLLNEDGTLRAKMFNRENTIRNFGEEIGYTQGVGLSYSVEFDTFKELLDIIFSGKNKKAKKEENKTEDDTEAEEDLMPEYITMKKKKTKSKS